MESMKTANLRVEHDGKDFQQFLYEVIKFEIFIIDASQTDSNVSLLREIRLTSQALQLQL